MGRTPKPETLKRLEGDRSKGKARGRTYGFAVEPAIPPAPAWLSGEALAEYERIAPVLRDAGLLGKIDRAALAGYAQTWALYCAAARDVAERGTIIPGQRNGEPVKNPSVAMQRDAAATLRGFVREFGLSPAARASLPVSPVKDDGRDADVVDLFS